MGQEEWNELSDKLIHVLQNREIAADIVFIRNIKSLLWNQGKTVYQANDKMAEKLSRIISEKEITKHRRLRKQIATVKELLFQERMKDSVRLLGISLSNLNTEIKKTIVVQLKFDF